MCLPTIFLSLSYLCRRMKACLLLYLYTPTISLSVYCVNQWNALIKSHLCVNKWKPLFSCICVRQQNHWVSIIYCVYQWYHWFSHICVNKWIHWFCYICVHQQTHWVSVISCVYQWNALIFLRLCSPTKSFSLSKLLCRPMKALNLFFMNCNFSSKDL